MRVISHSLKRANSKNFKRLGKTFQFPAFRVQSQLCSSNTEKVRAILTSLTSDFLSCYILMFSCVHFWKALATSKYKNYMRSGKPFKFPAICVQLWLCSSNTLEVRGVWINKSQMIFIKLGAHFPNLNFGCCLQTALISKVFELQSWDCAQNEGNFKGFSDLT